jgi:hypothetical protein
VSVLLIDTSARLAIASFMTTFEKTHPTGRNHSKDFARLQLKLWRLVLNQNLFPPDFIAENRRRIVTSCVYAVTVVNDIFLDTEDISVAIGAGCAGIGGYDMDTYLLRNGVMALISFIMSRFLPQCHDDVGRRSTQAFVNREEVQRTRENY